jgi:hypothetical protein
VEVQEKMSAVNNEGCRCGDERGRGRQSRVISIMHNGYSKCASRMCLTRLNPIAYTVASEP